MSALSRVMSLRMAATITLRALAIGFNFVTSAIDVNLMSDVVANNNGNGVFITGGTFEDFVIQDSELGQVLDNSGNEVLAGNKDDGFFDSASTFDGLAFLNSTFNRNGGDGVDFFKTTIESGTVTFDNPPPVPRSPIVTTSSNATLTTGFTLKDSQVVGNAINGVEFDGVIATDVTFNKASIAGNGGNGVFIRDTNTGDGISSSFTDFVIENSHLGEVLDGSGEQIFAGNQDDGFRAEDTSFTGVAFVDSFFNANDTAVYGGDGIRFVDSMITTGAVTFDDQSALVTGFTSEGSQVVENGGDGVGFSGVMAEDVTINDTDIAANALDGVLISDGSAFIDLIIQNSRLGEVVNSGSQVFAGNGANEFRAIDSAFEGVEFLGSLFNRNGGAGTGYGVFIGTSTITPEIMTLNTGFTFDRSQAIGNTASGIAFDAVNATDVAIRNASIANNTGSSSIPTRFSSTSSAPAIPWELGAGTAGRPALARHNTRRQERPTSISATSGMVSGLTPSTVPRQAGEEFS
jgi:hypothetical protein